MRTHSPELNRIAVLVAKLAIFHMELTVTVDNTMGDNPSISGMSWAGREKK